jgi:transcriptional regulator with XRE-family HTH domain
MADQILSATRPHGAGMHQAWRERRQAHVRRATETDSPAYGQSSRQSRHGIGEVIRARRRELGLTQEDLAQRVCNLGDELRQSDVSRMEHGKVTLPRYQRMACLAAALELSLGDLLSRAGWDGAEHASWEPDGTRPRVSEEHVASRTSSLVSSYPHDDTVIARAEASLAETEIVLSRFRETARS